MRLPAKFRIVLLTLLALSAGCNRGDPQRDPISAKSASALSRWRSGVGDRLTAEQWHEFDAMLQEIRLKIMAEKQATGSEPIEAALRERINGSTFREVVAMGLQFKLARLENERDIARRLLNANAHRVLLYGRDSEIREMERARDRHEKKLLEIDREIEAAKRRLINLGQVVPETRRR